MKKFFTLFATSLLTGLILTSCSGEAFDVDSVNKQTILVFMPWSGSEVTQQSLQNDLDSIETAIRQNKGLKNSRVLVFMGDNANASRLFEITYNGSNFQTEHTPIASYDGNIQTTATGIASILGDVYTHAEALNYALVVGTHQYAAPTPQQSTVSTETLGEGIKQSGHKMQYVFFDGSYMATAAAAYDLRDASFFMIASSSEISTDHIPYTSIWKSLNNVTAPAYSSVVSGYCSYFTGSERPFATLSVIDCREIAQLGYLMKEVNSQYTATSEVLTKTQSMDQYSPHIYYDMGDYVDSLKVGNSLNNRFLIQLRATVKASQSTTKLLTTASQDTIQVHHYTGITFCDPSSHAAVADEKSKTAWWKATH